MAKSRRQRFGNSKAVRAISTLLESIRTAALDKNISTNTQIIKIACEAALGHLRPR